MGLLDIAENIDKDSSSSSDSSSSGKNTQNRVPYLIINYYEDRDEWNVEQYPGISPITFIKKNGRWVQEEKMKHEKRIVWSRNEFDLLKDRAERHFNLDLINLLREDPERALKAIRKTSKLKTGEKPEKRPKCAVCDRRHNILNGEYTTIDNRTVCTSHSVQDLLDNNVL